MKKTFTVAALTPTTTTQVSPQSQLAMPPSPSESLTSTLSIFIPIIAVCIATWGQWKIHRSNTQQSKKSRTLSYWEKHLADKSSLLNLEDIPQYHELLTILSSSDKNELLRKLSEYKERFNSFEKSQLPKLRLEAKNALNADRQMFENLIGLPTDLKVEEWLHSEHKKSLEIEAKEALEKPLRAFLVEVLARL